MIRRPHFARCFIKWKLFIIFSFIAPDFSVPKQLHGFPACCLHLQYPRHRHLLPPREGDGRGVAGGGVRVGPPAPGPGLHRVRGGVGADELFQPLGPGEAEEGEQPRHRQLGGEAQVLEPHQVDPAGEPGTQLLQISSLVSI